MPAVGDPVLAETTPGFIVASSSETTDSSTFTTTETGIGSVTAPLVDGVTYMIDGEAQIRGTAGDVVQALMREDSTSGTVIDRAALVVQSGTDNRATTMRLRALYTATATGNKTFVVTAQRDSGAGNVLREAGTTHPQIITVTVT